MDACLVTSELQLERLCGNREHRSLRDTAMDDVGIMKVADRSNEPGGLLPYLSTPNDSAGAVGQFSLYSSRHGVERRVCANRSYADLRIILDDVDNLDQDLSCGLTR